MAYEKIVFPFKDSDEVLDYVLDWSARLGSDTIATSEWALAVDPDYALNIDSEEESATTTTIWLSGGTPGQTYEITNHIVTAGGREMEQTAKIRIKEK
jgi:hypothetical protein